MKTCMSQLLSLCTVLAALCGCAATDVPNASVDLSTVPVAAANQGHEPWVYRDYDEYNAEGVHVYSYHEWKLKESHYQIVDRRYPNTNRRYLYVLEVIPGEDENDRPQIIQVFGTAWTTTESEPIPPIYEIIPNEYLGTRLHLKDGQVFLVLSEARQEDYQNAHDPLAVFEVIDGQLHVARVQDWYALFAEHAAFHQSYIDRGWSVNPLSERFRKQLDRMQRFYGQSTR